MSDFLGTLRNALEPLRAQWQASALLRVGAILVASLLVLEGLLRLMDQADAWHEQAAQLRRQAQTQTVSGSLTLWQERGEQARVALAAWRERQWRDTDTGLLESQLQDRLRELAGRSQLTVRELGVLRGTAAVRDESAVRLRLQMDFQRAGLLALLSELESLPQPLVVDRLHLRLNSQPPVVELELRAVREVSAGKGAS